MSLFMSPMDSRHISSDLQVALLRSSIAQPRRIAWDTPSVGLIPGPQSHPHLGELCRLSMGLINKCKWSIDLKFIVFCFQILLFSTAWGSDKNTFMFASPVSTGGPKAPACGLVFNPSASGHVAPQPAFDVTNNFISYLVYLVEQRLIGETHLRRTLDSSRGTLENPITDNEALLNPLLLIHRNQIEVFIKTGQLNLQQVQISMQGLLDKLTETQTVRQEARQSTQLAYRKTQFHPVPPGFVWLYPHGDESAEPAKLSLSYWVEAADTPVTQAEWVLTMGHNPSEHAEGPTTVEWIVNEKKIRLQPNNPVEKISWWSALVFTNEYSRKHNLPEAYDLSGLSFTDSTGNPTKILQTYEEILAVAAKGTLYVSEQSLSPRYTGRANRPQNTRGFRILTTIEYARVMTGGQQRYLSFCFGGDLTQALRYGWFQENSDGATLPVATLLPCKVYGHEFFDLQGNVRQMAFDYYMSNSGRRSESMQIEKNEDYIAAIGLAANFEMPSEQDESTLRSLKHSFTVPTSKNSGYGLYGFRIGRSIPSETPRAR